MIRFRQDTLVTDPYGESKPAGEWVPTNGRARRIEACAITAKAKEVGAPDLTVGTFEA